jgi:hypothetical protein
MQRSQKYGRKDKKAKQRKNNNDPCAKGSVSWPGSLHYRELTKICQSQDSPAGIVVCRDWRVQQACKRSRGRAGNTVENWSLLTQSEILECFLLREPVSQNFYLYIRNACFSHANLLGSGIAQVYDAAFREWTAVSNLDNARFFVNQIGHSDFSAEWKRPVCCHHGMSIEAYTAGGLPVMEFIPVPGCDSPHQIPGGSRMMGIRPDLGFSELDMMKTPNARRTVITCSPDASGVAVAATLMSNFFGERCSNIRA